MAVALITAMQRFVGVSSDTKPAAPPVGSTFYETDTQTEYVWDGLVWRQRP